MEEIGLLFHLKKEGGLPDKEFTFIDNAMKENSNFGVYGAARKDFSP